MNLVRFTAHGEVVFIFEDHHPMMELGPATIQRASHVEPTEDAMWQADMKPMGGPKLMPTTSREQSLLLERAWLQRNTLDL